MALSLEISWLFKLSELFKSFTASLSCLHNVTELMLDSASSSSSPITISSLLFSPFIKSSSVLISVSSGASISILALFPSLLASSWPSSNSVSNLRLKPFSVLAEDKSSDVEE
eukprot:09586.XXX_5669_6007_1 [CDS] Oithona nana genome sequencing.